MENAKTFINKRKKTIVTTTTTTPTTTTTVRKLDGSRLNLAADTFREMDKWKYFFKKHSDYEEGHCDMHEDPEIKGFLWVRLEDKWCRFYCIADGERLEWFKTSLKDVVCIIYYIYITSSVINLSAMPSSQQYLMTIIKNNIINNNYIIKYQQ